MHDQKVLKMDKHRVQFPGDPKYSSPSKLLLQQKLIGRELHVSKRLIRPLFSDAVHEYLLHLPGGRKRSMPLSRANHSRIMPYRWGHPVCVHGGLREYEISVHLKILILSPKYLEIFEPG